jgi:superoxide dismutase, Fe-Mn family
MASEPAQGAPQETWQVEACAQVIGWCQYELGRSASGAALGDGWRRTLAALEAEARSLLHAAAAGADRAMEIARLVSVASQSRAAGQRRPTAPVPIGGHTLPPLPYPYDALEPHIDEATMRLHHTKHHQRYVDGLNRAEREMAGARETDDFDLLKHWEREAAFHGAGHYLHSIFWQNMKPGGGGEPSGRLASRLGSDFGGLEPFRRHFTEAAARVEAVGWALLVWAPRAHRLEILQAEKHQNLSQWDVVPLLVLDVWEHAHYLKYPNDRKAYIEAWWNVVNWEDVARRFEAARELRWTPS